MAKRIVIWSPTARADLRAIDRETAWQILQAIDRYLETGAGGVIKLQPPRTEFRLPAITACYSAESVSRPSRSSASAIAARRTGEPSYSGS